MPAASTSIHSQERRASSSGTVPCTYCDLPVRVSRKPADNGTVPSGPVYCCYGCRFASDITQARGEHGQATLILTRLGLSIFLSMSVMIFSLYLYSREAYFTDADDASTTANALTELMRYASLLFTAPVFILLGFPLIESSIEQWKRGVASTDALVVLGVGAAFVFSVHNTFNGGMHTYFETVCMVLVLVTLGRWLEATAKLRASDAAKSLSGLLPPTVEVWRGAQRETIASETLKVGDQFFIPAGQRIVADGVIEKGSAGIDESIVTGESVPQLRTVGDTVLAGSTAVDGALTIRATAVGTESTLGHIEALLAAARREKSDYERLADRVASWFLPLTIVAALSVGVAVGMLVSFETGLLRALAMLLIACPCALGIATPTAIWAALGHAARMGALCTNAHALERLNQIKGIAFDKTGTLTTGIATVETFTMNSTSERDEVLSVAAGLAHASRHVVSQSIEHFAAEKAVTAVACENIQTEAGRGVRGTWKDTPVYLGSPAFMTQSKQAPTAQLAATLDSAQADGKGVCCIGWQGTVRGLFVFGETLRAAARETVDVLKHRDIKTFVLTGDHDRRAARLAAELGIDAHADLLPQDKPAALQDIRRTVGPVAMVGDGVNDSPALATADVGIALGCGADVARDAADICLLGNDLRTIPALIDLSRQTIRTIRLNLFWAFAFNVVGITLAATGQLTPIFAAIAMVLSSVLVVGNSLRLATANSDEFQYEQDHPHITPTDTGEVPNKKTDLTSESMKPMPASRSDDGAVAPVCNRWEPPTSSNPSRHEKSPATARTERATS